MERICIIVDQTKCMECGKEVDEDNSLARDSFLVKRGKSYSKSGFICFDCAGWDGNTPVGRAHIGPGTEEYERRLKA